MPRFHLFKMRPRARTNRVKFKEPMKVFVAKPQDKIEEFRRAREILKALDEYGFKYTGKSGEDYFEVSFGEHASPAAVSEFLSNLGARGVSIQPEDASALVPAGLEARAIKELIDQKLLDSDYIPTEYLGDTVQNWRDSLNVSPAELDAATEERIYQEIVAEREPEGWNEVQRQEHVDGISRLAADLDAELAELRKAGAR